MLQVQLYVNEPHLREVLEGALLRELDLRSLRPSFEWASPLQARRYAEFNDAAFLRAVGLDELVPELFSFWPRGGPHWDALARMTLVDGTTGVLLVEAKSYPKELRDKKGCGATSEQSREQIREALLRTQKWLSVDVPVDVWMGPLYQTANRFAFLRWLYERLGGRAWLVHLLFTDDPTHVAASEDEWRRELRKAEVELGLTQPVPNYAHVFLPGQPREALQMSPAPV